MIISLIAAVAENNVLGKDNQLIWHLPADLKFFKQTTSGRSIIMGRKTFDSIGRPLPNRKNIVITRDENFVRENVVVVNSLQAAIDSCSGEDEIFIVGGAQIYKEAIPMADIIYLTRVHHQFEGDVFFPELNSNEWKLVSEEHHLVDEKNKYDFTFTLWVRKN